MDNGQKVQEGDKLFAGAVNPHELMEHRGALLTAQYIVEEVQKVYTSQGVDINDKHIELIVRQMTKKVIVDTSGDTTFLPGQMVDRPVFMRENQAVAARGGEEAVATRDHTRYHQGLAWPQRASSRRPPSRRPPRYSPTRRSRARPTTCAV